MLKKFHIAVLLLGGLLLTAPPGEAASRLVIDAPEFDFGYVPQNSKISHKFALQSAGDDSLKIVKVIPGCGCTQTPLDKRELAPGESTDLEVIFNTGRYSSRVTKRPKIQSNDDKKVDDVIIHATVVRRPDSTQPVIVKPYKLDISQFGEKKRNEMKFTITNVSEQDLKIRLIDLAEDMFEVTVVENIGAGETAEGVLRIRPEAVDMPFEKSFTFECSDDASSRFTVPVKRAVKTPGASKPMTANIKKKPQ